jgi:hypothetical protein
MTRTTDYIIVSSKFNISKATHEDLTAAVQEKLKEGYEPLGGPFVGGESMYQAMVKTDQNSTSRDASTSVAEFGDRNPKTQATRNLPNDQKYMGELKNGVPNGHGTLTFPDGQKYEGSWKDGRFDGHGVYAWPNGRKYEGQFRDGKMDGAGKTTYPNGKVEHGFWKDGNFVGSP